MKTDIPLKRLTRLCPGDLLPLLGAADSTVVAVETLELPAGKSSLDTVLRLRTPTGQEYLHLVEWQGYNDNRLLWRTLGYLAWLGQNRDERPLLATIIYLRPEDDSGATLAQALPGQPGWQVTLPCVRLWEQDAAAALASGAPGLLALAPLMGGATAELVEQAARQLIAQTVQPTQSELLVALGVFAEPLIESQRFLRLVTRERLMASDLISLLFEEQIAEFEQEKAAFQRTLEQKQALLEQKQALLEQEKTTLEQALQQQVIDVLITRFPDAPLRLHTILHKITSPSRLVMLHQKFLTDTGLALADAERLLTEAAG